MSEYYDEDAETMSVGAIPDLNKLMNHIINMLSFVDMLKESGKSNQEIENVVIQKYQNDITILIIKELLENRKYALEKLLNMFTILGKVKEGKADLHEEYEKFGERQNEEFIYPKFGGKEQFEKQIRELNERASNK